MRELRNGKSYETKWYIVNEIGFGDVAAVDTLLPRTRFKSIVYTTNNLDIEIISVVYDRFEPSPW